MPAQEPLQIIHEDDRLLVINKKAGFLVHGDGRSSEQTLADVLVAQFPSIASVGEPWTAPDGTVIYRPGIVHRLDRDTSGVLVLAKTQEMFAFLKQQFQDRTIHKTYVAFVYGNITEDEGVIDKPIAKSKKDFRRWSAQPGARGQTREAVTEYTVLKRTGEVAYLELRPKTGRTHQLRVHMKAIHHPIVCDPLYAESRPCLLGFGRVALHAKMITIPLPEGGDMTFEAPLPEDFEQALAQL
jgi:23S rRNA pseudouridine1911/1915/1917 synthase